MAITRSRHLPWIGTGWKMTKNRDEASAYTAALAVAAPDFVNQVNAFVLPAYPLIESVAAALIPAGIEVGAQNVHWADSGAFTGEVSAPMLIEIGTSLVCIGHAERRAMFGETDETVAAHVAGALRSRLTPLICVGESADDRNAGVEVAFVTATTRDRARRPRCRHRCDHDGGIRAGLGDRRGQHAGNGRTG